MVPDPSSVLMFHKDGGCNFNESPITNVKLLWVKRNSI